jgi:hypothetical protein
VFLLFVDPAHGARGIGRMVRSWPGLADPSSRAGSQDAAFTCSRPSRRGCRAGAAS